MAKKSAVAELKKRNHATHTLDGVDYVCHKWSMLLAFEAFGVAAFNVVDNDDGTQTFKMRDDVLDRFQSLTELATKALPVVMISPKLGDVDDEKADTVTARTMGDHVARLFSEVTNQTVEDAAGFPESSKDQTGSG